MKKELGGQWLDLGVLQCDTPKCSSVQRVYLLLSLDISEEIMGAHNGSCIRPIELNGMVTFGENVG